MRIIGIYKITSPSDKIYIGQSTNILSRQKSYGRSSGYKFQTKLKNSILKYGFKSHTFQIIEECSFESLNKKERYWQDYYDVLGPNGLNCILQETNSVKRRISKDTINKMKVNSLGNKNPMFGKTHSKETKNKISKSLKGLFSGEKHPAFGTKHNRNKKGVEASNYGRKHSDKSKLKMSKAQKGKTVSKEGRENISNSKIGVKNPKSKIVLNLDCGVFYHSAKEASEYSQYTYDYLKRILSGQYKNKTNLIYC